MNNPSDSRREEKNRYKSTGFLFTGVARSFQQGGQNEGGFGMRGRSPSHGKEISCLKTTSSCTLLGGVLCSGIDKFPTLFFFFSF